MAAAWLLAAGLTGVGYLSLERPPPATAAPADAPQWPLAWSAAAAASAARGAHAAASGVEGTVQAAIGTGRGAAGVMASAASAPPGMPAAAVDAPASAAPAAAPSGHAKDAWLVNGQRVEVVNARPSADSANNPGEVLELKDPATGQVSFRRSALRLTLVEGHRVADVVAGLPGVVVEFANKAYADVLVTPAALPAVTTALAADPRVRTVELAALRLPRRPK